MNLNLDKVLVKSTMILNGSKIKKSAVHVMNKMVNLTPNRATLASTDHTIDICSSGKWMTFE